MSENHHTALAANPEIYKYKFLPESWNLLDCFEYYFKEKELWTTKSLENEFIYIGYKDDDSLT